MRQFQCVPTSYVAENKEETILRRKSLVSTDTVCNNFVRES